MDETARIAAEEWQQIVNSAVQTAIISTDREGRVRSWNSGAEHILGWTEAEMLGESLSRIFPERPQETLAQEIADARQHGRGGGEEGWRLRKDGTRVWAAGEITPIRNSGGEVVGYVKVLRDRTAQRAAEDALREERRALEILNKAGSALSLEPDLQKLVQIVTDAGVALSRAEFGAFFYNVLNAQGESYMLYTISGVPREAFSKFPMPRNTAVFSETFSGKGIVRSNDITQDPRYGKNAPHHGMPPGHLPVRSYLAVPVISRNGEVLGGLFFGHSRTGVFNERSERGMEALAAEAAIAIDNARLAQAAQRENLENKQLVKSLQESEEKLRLLADTIPQLAWMARPDGNIFWYNRRWYEYTGTTAAEMEGWGWQSVHDPQRLPDVLELWKASLVSGQPFEMVFPLRGADGQFRPFLTRVNPLRDTQGHILYWFGTNTDISEIKRMEEALRDADRRKDEFLATLAHELRNPLAPIRNSLQILKMPRVDAKFVHQATEIMDRQVNALVRLVDDLLDVARVVRGKIVLRREPVELATIIARAVETAQGTIQAHGHELELSIPSESLLVNADPVRLVQVVSNLLTNSAKYTPANGHIRVSAGRSGNEAVLRVRDNGVGIAPYVLPHVFDLFVQADDSFTKAQGGLGIGLTLVRNLAELHGGSVEAHSDGPGKGSEFTVRLPLITNARDEVEEAIVDPAQSTGSSGHRLLVVDDNEDAAISLAMMLRLEGHDVRVAHDGPTALNEASSFRPSMVFLDLGMPHMDGYEVARRLRQQPGMERVVLTALTGWGQENDRRRTAAAGFDHHLVKPPEPKRLQMLLAGL